MQSFKRSAWRPTGLLLARFHSAFETIPVIDVSPLLQDKAQDDEKSKIAISPERHYRGYQQLGANVTRYDGSFQRDWHEAIDLYHETAPARSSALHGCNQWPSQHPHFVAELQQYIASLTTVGERVMRGVALGLGLPPSYFQQQMNGPPYWCMRVIHYPPLTKPYAPAEDGSTQQPGGPSALDALHGAELPRSTQLSCGEHTDYGLLTLVNQEEHVSALQVKNADGAWITAAPIPGTLVCNIGDMMRIWTNGEYTPTLHRVVNPDPSRSRVSIPYFYEPAFDTVVRPIAGLGAAVDQQPLLPKLYGTHLEEKVFSNFELPS